MSATPSTAMPTTATTVRRAMGDSGLRGSLSSFMNIEHSVGITVSATNRDDDRVMMRVRGRLPMNSPTMPGQNIRGVNAASVVAVDPITGSATSAVPFLAAHTRSQPCSMKR